MIKAPRYPDITEKPSSPLLRAASQFTGVLNVAYHSPTSYAQKHLRKNAAPLQEESRHDPLLTTTADNGMTLRKIHRETVRRQRYLQERKKQAELEESKLRERVLEERHLRRLEQAKLIRCRVYSMNSHHTVLSSNTQRAYSERAFPAKQADRPYGSRTDYRTPKKTEREQAKPIVYQQRQQWQLPERSDPNQLERRPCRLFEDPQVYPKEGYEYAAHSLQRKATSGVVPAVSSPSAAERSPSVAERSPSVADLAKKSEDPRNESISESELEQNLPENYSFRKFRVKEFDPHDSDDVEVFSNVSESTPGRATTATTCFEATKRYGQLQPLCKENLEHPGRYSDQKSIQSEPPLRPRLLKISKDREEDELMKNLAGLNEKLAALRLRKSFRIPNDDGGHTDPDLSKPVETSNNSLLPDIKPKKQWLTPKLVRTPSTRSRRNRAR